MTDAYHAAKQCIIRAFDATPDMTHETTETLVPYINILADAWLQVYTLLHDAGRLGYSLGIMMLLNDQLSGDMTYCVPQRTTIEVDYEESEWLHDCYTMHLAAILEILSLVAP